MRVRILSPEDLQNLSAAEAINADLAKRFLFPLIAQGLPSYIGNVHSQLLAVQIDDLVLPVSVDRKHTDAYIVSPYTHFIEYVADEIERFNNPLLRKMIRALIFFIGPLFLKFGWNKTVSVNNWLVSTNLHYPLRENQIGVLTSFLAEQFPDHAIIYRSLNSGDKTHSGRSLLEAFKTFNYRLILSRVIFLRQQSSLAERSRSSRSDDSLAKKSGYELKRIEQLSDSEWCRIEELYRMLYLDKHSQCNPSYNKEYFKLAFESGFMDGYVLQKAGRIDGFVGLLEREGQITAPVLGYDTALPPSEGLYRLLFLQLFREATRRSNDVHCSSGSGEYKLKRGATPTIEYMAVYTRHLCRRQNTPWGVLGYLMNKVGMPLALRLYCQKGNA